MENNFGERLESVAKTIGGISVLARLAGISRRSLILYISGKVDPSRKRLLNMAKVGGVNFEWLASGRGPMKGGCNIEANMVLIPTILDNGSSGNHFAISKDFLQNLAPQFTEKLRFIRCNDFSMEPAIDSGSLVLVDEANKELQSHDIICLRNSGRYLFRRIIQNDVADEFTLACDRFPQQKILSLSDFQKIDYVGKAIYIIKQVK